MHKKIHYTQYAETRHRKEWAQRGEHKNQAKRYRARVWSLRERGKVFEMVKNLRIRAFVRIALRLDVIIRRFTPCPVGTSTATREGSERAAANLPVCSFLGGLSIDGNDLLSPTPWKLLNDPLVVCSDTLYSGQKDKKNEINNHEQPWPGGLFRIPFINGN